MAKIATPAPPDQPRFAGQPDRGAGYALADENGGTRVTVTLTGFEVLPAAAVQERLGPTGAGWEKALQNLKAFVAGAPLPFSEGGTRPLVFGYRRETAAKQSVERSIWINAPRERVWRAVTVSRRKSSSGFPPAPPGHVRRWKSAAGSRFTMRKRTPTNTSR